ncbi:MAG: hypothetical protein ACNI25_05625 [Halarcobacter sp.]
MKIINILPLTLFISLFFTACSEKTNAMRYFNDSTRQSINSIQFTQKVDLLLNNQNEVTIIASYLNEIDKEFKSDNYDTFLVAIQIFNNVNLFKDRFKILLDGKRPVSYEKIDNSSDLIKKISLKNHWAKYYLVKFKKEVKKNNILNLTISHSRLGETTIAFGKEKRL